MLYTICIYYSIFFKTTIKTCFAQTQMLANELSFGGSLPQTFSTIPCKSFTDRPYNKPGQVGYFKVPQGS